MTDQTNGKATEESLIEFPCEFVIKVMGKNTTDFEQSVIVIAEKHFPDFDASDITKKYSKDNNYLSLSVKVHAQNKAQLDATYQALTQCEDVLMCL